MACVSVPFDFEEWVALARRDPEEFERRRREAVLPVIKVFTDIRRGEALQSRIDFERIRARTPLKATIRISSMMWDSFFNLSGGLNRMFWGTPSKRLSRVPIRAAVEALPTAKIILFGTRRD